MSKFSYGNGQYVVYAQNEQEARKVVLQELQRFDNIKSLMCNLLTQNGQAWQNFVNNISEERLNIHFNDEKSAIYDKDSTAKGEVRHQRDINGNAIIDQNGLYKYELAYRYPEIAGHDANFRLAHEMGHLMLNASNPQRQLYDKESNSRQVSGLIRRDESTNRFYGIEMQENAINLIAQLAIRGNVKADDIIEGKIDLSEFNSYKKCDDLVKLLVISMRNDFDEKMSFEQLVDTKLDALITRSDGTREPANVFFYGILNDSSVIQNEFDKYMGKGSWRQVNEAFSELYKGNISTDRFNLIFKTTQDIIQEFKNIRFKEKSVETVVENNEFNNLNVQNKLTLKQRVAQFLQKNNIFMNLSFVEKYVHQQLDILPSHAQETKESACTTSRTENKWYYNARCRNLSSIQRMSDPQKIEEMKRKMEQPIKYDEKEM